MQTKLSARRRNLQKNTQRRNGVRMRYRRADRPAKQKRSGHGRYPFQASNHRRRLLFTRTACYFILCSLSGRDAGSIVQPAPPCCFITTCYSPCGEILPARIPGWRKPGPGARRNEICNRQCRAAPFRRAHGISLKNPTITGHDKPWEGVCPDIENNRCPLLFHAHCLLLYFVQLSFCRGPSNLLSEWLPRLW